MTHTPARPLARMAALVAVTATPVLAVAPQSAAATPAAKHPGHVTARHGHVSARHGHGPGPHATNHGQAQRAIDRLGQLQTRRLRPRTRFTMAPDGSSGRTQGGEGIPNIDIVKSTIRSYYGAGSDGIANRQHSPYVSQLEHILKKEAGRLGRLYRQAERDGKKPALVFDADDTTLMTYDMEDHAMHFHFDPQLQNTWVQQKRFPATPGMVAFVKKAQRMGFTIFGLTGRNDDQKAATVPT